MNRYITLTARAKLLHLLHQWEADAVRLEMRKGAVRAIEPQLLCTPTAGTTICMYPRVIVNTEGVGDLTPACIDYDYSTQEFVLHRSH